MARRIMNATAATLLVAALARGEARATTYEMRDLASTIGGTSSHAFGINDDGVVTGYYELGRYLFHAFVWDGATGIRDLGESTEAYAINDAGQVAGFKTLPGGDSHAFVWDPVAGMRDIGTLGGPSSYAFAINDAGQVAGSSLTTQPSSHAFIWDAALGMRDIGTLGGTNSEARAINDAGQVAGSADTADGATHAFVWDAALGMRDVGTLGGASSAALAMNDAGQVVGWAETAGGTFHAFIWDATTGMRDLGTLGGTTSVASAINDAGQVAGSAATASGPTHAFVWDAALGMSDIGTLGGGAFGEPDTRAWDINDAGQVVGDSGPLGDAFPPEVHAFIAEPVTPPPCASAGGDADGDGVCAPVVSDIHDLVTYTESLPPASFKGDGPTATSAAGRQNAFENMLRTAGDLVDAGDLAGACGQLHAALVRVDGQPRPPDFVTGDAADEVAGGIQQLMASLGCD
jgi:probable HAF family extracellular repeat protein